MRRTFALLMPAFFLPHRLHRRQPRRADGGVQPERHGKEERDAFEAAMIAYDKERPGEERLAASARVAEMIASAVRVDPVWFWKSVRKPGTGQGTNAEDSI